MIKPSLLPLTGSVLQGRRYLLGEQVLFGDYVKLGGIGTLIESNLENKIKLSVDNNINKKIDLELKSQRIQDVGVLYETVTLHQGESIGLLLALTYNDNYQYIKITNDAGGYINDLESGPKLEIIN